MERGNCGRASVTRTAVEKTGCFTAGRARTSFSPIGSRLESRMKAMEADESLGETKGGLQAPYVVVHDGQFHMLYGDWNSICLAVSKDGKNFTRVVQPNGKSALYADGECTRDPMALKIDGLWYAYT